MLTTPLTQKIVVIFLQKCLWSFERIPTKLIDNSIMNVDLIVRITKTVTNSASSIYSKYMKYKLYNNV